MSENNIINISINDLKTINTIKITKIRNYEIIFRVINSLDGKEYLCLIHENSEDSSIKEFYVKKFNSKNNKFIFQKIFVTNNTLLNYFFKECNVENRTYKSLDKNYFAFKLNKSGFITSFYQDEIDQQNQCIKELKNKLKLIDLERNRILMMIESLEE